MSPRSRRRRSPVPLAAAALVLATVAGCSPTVAMQPAPAANDPGCAEAIVRLPISAADIEGHELRQTDAQATAAWGDPTVALLTCGVPVPGPSELPCIEIGGVFWLREELPRDDGTTDYAFTTYGRDPATRLVIDSDAVHPGIVLDDLATAIAATPGTGRECLALEDTVTGAELFDDAEPTPAPTED